ncbi:MAG: hypothetical protein R3B84_19860 [Zavarzinella sp.]
MNMYARKLLMCSMYFNKILVSGIGRQSITFVVIFLIVCMCGSCGRNASNPSALEQYSEENQHYEPLADEIVRAWEKAGAMIGWMKVDSFGHINFHNEQEHGAIPAFSFKYWNNEAIDSLPPPRKPFGISIVDNGLDEIRKGFSDRSAIKLIRFKNLRFLQLAGAQLTDEGILHLQSHAELTTLDLARTLITDLGLQYLTPLNRLHTLCLSSTAITDHGLPSMKALKNLNKLDLSFTELTGTTFDSLRDLPNLKLLNLNGMKIHQNGWQKLSLLTTLEYLDLSYVVMENNYCNHLAKLENLTCLSLHSVKIQDD